MCTVLQLIESFKPFVLIRLRTFPAYLLAPQAQPPHGNKPGGNNQLIPELMLKSLGDCSLISCVRSCKTLFGGSCGFFGIIFILCNFEKFLILGEKETENRLLDLTCMLHIEETARKENLDQIALVL